MQASRRWRRGCDSGQHTCMPLPARRPLTPYAARPLTLIRCPACFLPFRVISNIHTHTYTHTHTHTTSAPQALTPLVEGIIGKDMERFREMVTAAADSKVSSNTAAA